MKTTGLRRKARVVALQALYEVDCSTHSPEDVLPCLIRDKALPDKAANFSHELVNGVLLNKQDIDNMIQEFAPAFPLEQIANVDRNILRLAIFEVLFNNKVPFKVAINEAVELAKIFGGDASPKFINGVLGAVVTARMKDNYRIIEVPESYASREHKTMLERIKKVIAEQLGVDEEPIVPAASFVEDLNVDPGDLAELMLAMENEFSTPARKLEISDEDIEKIVTVQDLIDCLCDYGVED